MLRIVNPGLERRSVPGTDASAQMNWRGKASSRDAPIERRTRQSRHPDHVSDAVKRRNDSGSTFAFVVDPTARTHRRMLGDVLPFEPGFRRCLRAPDRLVLPRPRAIPRFSAHQATASDRWRRMARLWSLSFFEILPTRHNPAITHRSRRLSRARSWVHKSSCRGGKRS